MTSVNSPTSHLLSTRTQRHTKPPQLALLALLSLCFVPGKTYGQRAVTFWDTQTGSFSDSANWSAGTPETALDGKIDNGGTALLTSAFPQSGAYVFLGSSLNTSGTMVVSGAGTASFSSMIVGGRGGSGSLSILAGGTISSFGGVMAADAASTGATTIDGTGSSWTVSGPEMRIGSVGNGTLHLQNGGTLRVANGNGRIVMGSESLGEGRLFIGNGTAVGEFDVSEISVGTGKATLTFNHTNPALTVNARLVGVKSYDGFFNVLHSGAGTTILTAPESNFAGLIEVAGGTLIANGSIMGSLRDVVVNDEVVTERNVGEVAVLTGGSLGGQGFIEGKTTVAGKLIPGYGLGILGFGGDLTLASEAVATFELGGRVRGTSYDGINAAGVLTYGGTLRLSLVNGFFPTTLDTFDLFNGYSSFSGSFASIEFSNPAYTGSFNPQTGVLSVQVVPEPSVAGLMLAALLPLALRRPKRTA